MFSCLFGPRVWDASSRGAKFLKKKTKKRESASGCRYLGQRLHAEASVSCTVSSWIPRVSALFTAGFKGVDTPEDNSNQLHRPVAHAARDADLSLRLCRQGRLLFCNVPSEGRALQMSQPQAARFKL